ncbi:MAG: DUF3857 domain-containing protein [Chitinophagaceae bacterium]|nr:DUF3857 domain-containing protein [Chitinophagaceae bacterium]
MQKLLSAFFILCSVSCFSQQNPTVKFGKISIAEIERKNYDVDTSAEAVVIADIGATQIKGNRNEWFSLEFRRHKRIHILKRNAYSHATVEISLYTDGKMEEQLDDVKAVTYNYENGKIVETKLDVRTGVFKDKLDKNRVVKKFTLPNVKEGSIIEYEYKVTSDFLFNLQPWYFQGDIPRLWSEYSVAIPSFLKYMLIAQGEHPFYLNTSKDKRANYSVELKKRDSYGSTTGSEQINITCGVTDFRWAMKNVPPLKEEAYTTTLLNYMAKLEFQLAAYLEPLSPQTVMSTWPDLAQSLLKRDDFGMQMENAATWMPGVLPAILQNATTETEKAKKIYAYLRDNVTCTDYRQLYTESTLRNVFDKKSGGVAEINLLLTAMLRYAGIRADPVILSRRDYGFVYDNYPVIGQFNYVISRAGIDGKEILLDASYPNLGFGKLNYDCYNGTAKVMNEQATHLSLKADQLTEKGNITVILSGNEKGEWKANINKLYGYYESVDVRKKLKANDRETWMKELVKEYDTEVKLENLRIDSLTALEEPIAFNYDISYGGDQANIVYLNPVITGRHRINPFKSTDRLYPVEMPYKILENYSIIIIVPEGYSADEMPKPLSLKMNEQGDASFSYSVSKPSANLISIQCRLEINKTLFQTSEYEALREFFNRVVAKQNEQIVLKKTK